MVLVKAKTNAAATGRYAQNLQAGNLAATRKAAFAIACGGTGIARLAASWLMRQRPARINALLVAAKAVRAARLCVGGTAGRHRRRFNGRRASIDIEGQIENKTRSAARGVTRVRRRRRGACVHHGCAACLLTAGGELGESVPAQSSAGSKLLRRGVGEKSGLKRFSGAARQAAGGIRRAGKLWASALTAQRAAAIRKRWRHRGAACAGGIASAACAAAYGGAGGGVAAAAARRWRAACAAAAERAGALPPSRK